MQQMFDAIAGRYDLMNRVMTLGQDQRWRRFVVGCSGSAEGGWLLDLATGTGDIAALLQQRHPQGQVVGADFSLNMLAEARRRFPHRGIFWQACDAAALPFVEESLAAVTFGYLLRNVDDAQAVLQEVYRVLRPGGRVVCLDTTPPAKNLLYPLLHGYFHYAIPLLGRLLANDASAYSYLTTSTMDFYSAEELAGLFRQAGFGAVGYRKFMLGTIAVHWGEK